MTEPVNVTSPYLPPLEEVLPYLEEIWDSKVLTNGGQFHQRFETALRGRLGVPEISLFSNATIALVCALQELRITGDVITTPYSFVATSHSLIWNGIRPIFVDIDPDTLNLDPDRSRRPSRRRPRPSSPFTAMGTRATCKASRR